MKKNKKQKMMWFFPNVKGNIDAFNSLNTVSSFMESNDMKEVVGMPKLKTIREHTIHQHYRPFSGGIEEYPLKKDAIFVSSSENYDLFEAIRKTLEPGGAIIFSGNINSILLSDNRIINKVKQLLGTIKNNKNLNTTIKTVVTDESDKVNKDALDKTKDKGEDKVGLKEPGWTLYKGNMTGNFVSTTGEQYKEKSIMIEILGVSNESLERIASALCRELKQDSVIIKFYDTGRVVEYENDEKFKLKEDIEVHTTLNPVLFKNGKMIPEVRQHCLEIASSFKGYLYENEIEIKLVDLVLVGSNASYNYTKDSDVDLHLLVSKDTLDETIQLYNAYKGLYNVKHNIHIKGYKAEVYVDRVDSKIKSNGIYSIKDNKWIKEPNKIEEQMPEYNKRLDQYILRFEEVEQDPSIELINELIDDIYMERKNGLEEDGEFSIGNLVFKEFRNIGYLETLKEMLVELEDKELSLESLNKEETDTWLDKKSDLKLDYFESKRKSKYGAKPGVALANLNEVMELVYSNELDNSLEEKLSYTDFPGGQIIFSQKINALPLDRNKFINKVKQIVKSVENRLRSENKIDSVLKQVNDNAEIGYTIYKGPNIKGRYVTTDKSYSEDSIMVEIVGVSNEILEKITAELCREFHQAEVMIKFFDTGRVGFYKNGDIEEQLRTQPLFKGNKLTPIAEIEFKNVLKDLNKENNLNIKEAYIVGDILKEDYTDNTFIEIIAVDESLMESVSFVGKEILSHPVSITIKNKCNEDYKYNILKREFDSDDILDEDYDEEGNFNLFISKADLEDPEIKALVREISKKSNAISIQLRKSMSKEIIQEYLKEIHLPISTTQFVSLFDSTDEIKNVIENRDSFAELSALENSSEIDIMSIANLELGADVAKELKNFTPKKNGAATGKGEVLCAVSFKDTVLSDTHSDLVVNGNFVEVKAGSTPTVGPFKGSTQYYSKVEKIFDDILHFPKTEIDAMSTINYSKMNDRKLSTEEKEEIKNIININASTTKGVFEELFMGAFNTYCEGKMILMCNADFSRCTFLKPNMSFEEINNICKLTYSSLPGQTYSYGFKFQKR